MLVATGIALAGELGTLGLLATGAWLLLSAALRPPVLLLSVAIGVVQVLSLLRGTARYAERLASHGLGLGLQLSGPGSCCPTARLLPDGPTAYLDPGTAAAVLVAEHGLAAGRSAMGHPTSGRSYACSRKAAPSSRSQALGHRSHHHRDERRAGEACRDQFDAGSARAQRAGRISPVGLGVLVFLALGVAGLLQALPNAVSRLQVSRASLERLAGLGQMPAPVAVATTAAAGIGPARLSRPLPPLGVHSVHAGQPL